MSTVHRSAIATGAARPADPTDPEAIVRVLFEKSPLLIYIADLDFKVVLFNRALREVTGYDTSDCPNVDQLVSRFYPNPDLRKIVTSIHDGWKHNEHIRDAELLVQLKDGTQRTVSWSTSRLRVGRGPSIGYVAFGIDVSTRRSLQQWVALFQRSFEHLKEGVVLSDPAGAVLSWSDGARRLLARSEETMLGRPLKDLYASAEREIIARTVDRAVDGDGRWDGEVELERGDGKGGIFQFHQVRLDGDGGVPLARLTVLREPDPTPELKERVAQLGAELERAHGVERQFEAQRTQAEDRATRAEDRARKAEERARAAEEQAKDAEAKAAESAARLAEVEEKTEETDRQVSAAKERLDAAEEARAQADAARSQAEEAQKAAEAARDGAEAARLAADALREQAEEGRKAAEASREEAQGARAAAESRALQAEEQAAASGSRARAAEEATQAAEERARAETKKAEAELAARTTLEGARIALDERVREADARVAELERRLLAAESRGEADEARAAELKAALERAERAEAEAERAAERWVKERSRLEEDQRRAVDQAQDKAAAQRKALEEQLSRDILAAEERGEAERGKLVARHEQERSEWQDATAIARAEAESELRAEIQSLRLRLDKSRSLQPHLARLDTLAVVAADTDGRVVGWSGGAARLDGRGDDKAIGAVIHKDVLPLRGVDWKTLFGKAVIAGRVEREVTLVSADGSARDARLVATLVKDVAGKPVGLLEVLREPELGGSLELHAEAALARVAGSLFDALEARAAAGIDAQQKLAAAVRDLLQLGRAVDEGGAWAEVEAAARRVDLGGLLRVTAPLAEGADDAWRELRATARDLVIARDSLATATPTSWRWNELVERCLRLCEVAHPGRQHPERKMADAGTIVADGSALLPLLLLVLDQSLPGGRTPATVETGGDSSHARIELAPGALEAASLPLARALATRLGAELDPGSPGSERAGSSIRLRVPRRPSPGLAQPVEEAAEAVPSLALVDIVEAGPEAPVFVDVAPDEVAAEDLEEAAPEAAGGGNGSAGPATAPKGPAAGLQNSVGEDSLVAALAQLGDVSGSREAPGPVSEAVLAAAPEMEAYAAGRRLRSERDGLEELPDEDATRPMNKPAPSAAAQVLAPPRPPELPDEMKATDSGERMTAAARKVGLGPDGVSDSDSAPGERPSGPQGAPGDARRKKRRRR
jgi:PAS domain S-box-containing protein